MLYLCLTFTVLWLATFGYLLTIDNKIKDISSLRKLTKVWSLYLDGNQVTDLKPIEELKWVASLDQGPARDSVVGALIYRIERDDPAAAAQWAETIVDNRKRDETFKRLLRRLDDSNR